MKLVTLVLSIAVVNFFAVDISKAQWVQSDTFSGFGNVVNDLAVRGDDLIAATSNGVFISTDEGNRWKSAGLKNETVDVLAIDGHSILAGTIHGLYKSTDEGSSWRFINLGLAGAYVSAIAVRGPLIFAGAGVGHVFTSSDGGAKWVRKRDIPGVFMINALTLVGTNLLAGTEQSNGGGGIFLSNDGGTTWSNIAFPNYVVTCMETSSENIIAGGMDMGVQISTNSGTSWTTTGLPHEKVNVLAVRGNKIFAGTVGHGVFLLADNGYAWMPYDRGLGSTTVRALALSSSSIFAGTAGSGVYRRLLRDSSTIDWGKFASNPAREALEKAEPLTEFRAAVLFAGMAGSLSPDNPALIKYFPQYASAKDEFERHRLIGSITDSLQRYYTTLQRVPYFYARCDGQLGQYNFNGHTFPFAGGVFQTGFEQFDVFYYNSNVGGSMFVTPMGNLPVAETDAQSFVQQNPDRKVAAYILCRPSGELHGTYMRSQLRMDGIYFIITTIDGHVLGIYDGLDAPQQRGHR